MKKKRGFMLSDVLFSIATLTICMYLSFLLASSYTKNLFQIKRSIYMLDEIKNKILYEYYVPEEIEITFTTLEEILIEDKVVYIKSLSVEDNGYGKKEYIVLSKE